MRFSAVEFVVAAALFAIIQDMLHNDSSCFLL